MTTHVHNKLDTIKTVCALVAENFMGFTRSRDPDTGLWRWQPPQVESLSEEERGMFLTEPPPILEPAQVLSFQKALVDTNEGVPRSRVRWVMEPFPNGGIRYTVQIAREDGRTGSAVSDRMELAVLIAALDMMGLAEQIEPTEKLLYPKIQLVR